MNIFEKLAWEAAGPVRFKDVACLRTGLWAAAGAVGFKDVACLRTGID
jgi:hypothetical protein